jgi:hypothetical protein
LTDHHLNDIISEWEQMLKRHALQGAISPYPEGSTWTDVFWRTLVGDIITEEFPVRKAMEADHAQYDAFRQSKSQNGICFSLREMVFNQSFFITTMGYLGLGPSTIRDGDEVWVLHGGRVPFILRPTSKEAAGNNIAKSTQHELVGDTYVHGIMNGEAETQLSGKQEAVLLV